MPLGPMADCKAGLGKEIRELPPSCSVITNARKLRGHSIDC